MAKKIRKRAKKAKSAPRYHCNACGLVISVDEACGCIDACDIICCGEQMKEKK